MALTQGTFIINAPIPLWAMFQFPLSSPSYGQSITGAAGSPLAIVQTGDPRTTLWSGAMTWNAVTNRYEAEAPFSVAKEGAVLHVEFPCRNPSDLTKNLDFAAEELFPIWGGV